MWRGSAQFCDFYVHVEAAVKVQSLVRMRLAQKLLGDMRFHNHVERRFFDFMARSTRLEYRSYALRTRLARAACVIQRVTRVYIRSRRASIADRGVRKLQAMLRAKVTRRKRSKRVAAVNSRLETAHRRARKDPKLRIGYKTRHALRVLQNSKSLAQIMDAVKSLETSTRLSQLSCALFTLLSPWICTTSTIDGFLHAAQA